MFTIRGLIDGREGEVKITWQERGAVASAGSVATAASTAIGTSSCAHSSTERSDRP